MINYKVKRNKKIYFLILNYELKNFYFYYVKNLIYYSK